jgi:hypothetical protein
MDNDETRMPNSKRMPKTKGQMKCRSAWFAASDFANSGFFRHLKFDNSLIISRGDTTERGQNLYYRPATGF